MADAPIASTIIAAVLETTGYVTQSNLLDSFAGFLGIAGEFFYTLSCIGAIMSVMIFGSYRYGRYLIVGPTLFWFLVGNRVDVKPAEWKLGGGDPVAVEQIFNNSAIEPYDPVANPPKLPWFFAYYTKAIDDVMNGLVNVILSHENDQDLLFQTRNQMLDFLLNIGPSDDEIYKLMGEGLFDECSTMTNLATSLADKRYSELHQKELVSLQAMNFPEAKAELEQIANEKKALQDAYARASKRPLQAGPITRSFVERQVVKQIQGGKPNGDADVDTVAGDQVIDDGKHPVTGQGYPEMLARGHSPQQFLASDLPNLNLNCGQMWTITEHAILEHSKELIKKANVQHLQGNIPNTPANREMMCRELAMKLSRDWNKFEGAASNCSLVEVVSTYMFKTAIARMPLSEKLKQKKERMALVGRTNDMMAMDNINDKDHAKRLITPSNGRPMQVKLDKQTGQTLVRDLNAEAKNNDGEEVWRPFVTIELESFSDTAFGHQQRTMARNLMQGLYSYAMNLPYYQGVLLYFLSLAYPFMCIMVVIPSRAMSFMLCPMMWLWVKSWDVGFAIVVILDKVLWNLLPNSDVPFQAFSGDAAGMAGVVTAAAGEASRLPEVLNSALAVDPSYHILAHYNFVSIALMSVPAFTGFAILKARSSILSSFTDGPKQIASEAGDMAFNAHNVNTSNIQRDKLHRFSGAALQASSDWGSGLMGDGRSKSGAAWALAKAASSYPTSIGNRMARGRKGADAAAARPAEHVVQELRGVNNMMNNAKSPEVRAKLKSQAAKLSKELSQSREADFLKSERGLAKVKRDRISRILESMESGAKTGFEMMLAEQAAQGRRDWAFNEDLGFFGYYSNRMRGVIAGTDGTGGFELEDIDVAAAVSAAEFELNWKRLDTCADIGGDVVKFLFNNTIDEMMQARGMDKDVRDSIGKGLAIGGGLADLYETDTTLRRAFGGESDIREFIDNARVERIHKDPDYSVHKKQWELFFGDDYEKMRKEREEQEEEIHQKEQQYEKERTKPVKKSSK